MSTDNPQKKYKRMAKNAGMLYIRMLLTMAVTLYTSRVVLQTLGVDDFGIYSVVAGFVTMLGFLNSAMSSATQRFLAFELGKSGDKDVRGIFSMSLNIHVLIAVFVFVLGETVGLWFVKTQMTIPADRMLAAEWVFHFALLSFAVTIISVPYNALIIAHERMSVFAWVSIIDVLLKLLIVFMLGWFGMDTLILYAVLSLAVVFIIFMVYRSYCKSRFAESRFRLYWDKQLFNIMLSYTGWNLWGNIAAVMSGQGVNVLLNIFFGPSVNAARAIAMQVSAALNSFVQNLQVAINPQIIKAYGASDNEYMHKLVCYGMKYNYFLFLLIIIPVYMNSDYILSVWLSDVPAYASAFVKITLIGVLIDVMSYPLITAAQATGRIKFYQIIMSLVLAANLIASYAVIKFGGTPVDVLKVWVLVMLVALICRVLMVCRLIDLRFKNIFKIVFVRVLVVTFFVLSAKLLIEFGFADSLSDLYKTLLVFSVCLLGLFFLGLSKEEKNYLLKKVLRF